MHHYKVTKLTKMTYYNQMYKGIMPPRRLAKKTTKATRKKSQELQFDSIETTVDDLLMNQTEEEPQVPMQFFGPISTRTQPCIFLITPNATNTFKHSIINRLQQLSQQYSRQSALKFMLDNLLEHQTYNIDNLECIDDQQFWNFAMPSLISLLYKKLPQLKISKFKILYSGMVECLHLTRLDTLLLLGSMFLGIMPKQVHEQQVTFGEIMTINTFDNDEKITLRRQKLKCLIAYFKVMFQNPQIIGEEVKLQRARIKDMNYFDLRKQKYSKFTLRKVYIKSINEGNIEDYCGKAIVANHSSKNIGFNALKSCKNREDVMFFIFPELIIIRLLCLEVTDLQAITLYGARRFADYNSQIKNFQFRRQHPLQSQQNARNSAIVSIDSANINKGETYNPWLRKGVLRQIHKAFVGFSSVQLSDENMPVCSGKWGCRAGGGNGQEAFNILIQWIAASKANRDLIYVVNRQQKITEFKLLIQELSYMQGLDLLYILLEYCEKRELRGLKTNLLDYLKENI